MSERVLEILGRPEVWLSVLGLIGFLVLTWLIRQAPIGQASRPEPRVGLSPAARDRAVSLAVGGFLLILLGGYLAFRVGVPASLPAFALGIGLVRWVARSCRPYRHDSPTVRRLVAFSESALTASLLAGVLLVGNALAFRIGGRPIDLTRDRAFTLSSLTLNQLRSLDQPARLTVFFGNSEGSRRMLDRVRQLVDLYRAANPEKVSVEYLDPFSDVREFEELAKRVPDVAAAGVDGVVVTLGEGPAAPRLLLGTRELFDVGTAGGDRYSSTFRGEDAITSALIQLREGRRSKVAFTAGHGEPSTTEVSQDRPGYGLWRARLNSMGSDVVDLNLRDGDVPADVGLLIIGGPRSAFTEEEVARVKAHLARGGSLIALVDNPEAAGLADLLRVYNVEVGRGVVADARNAYRGQPTLFPVQVAPRDVHPVVAPLVGQYVVFQDAAPLAIVGPGPASAGAAAPDGKSRSANLGIIATPFLQSSAESWAESDPRTRPIRPDRGAEPIGPQVLAVAATTRPAIASESPTPRAVILASPLMASNPLFRFNGDLLSNAVSWLRGKPELIGIAPKTHEAPLFAVDPGLQRRLVLVPTLVAVIVIAGLGLTTYLARRD